jgi:hypothetical protein
VLISLIKKKIEEQPRRWHRVSDEALWACRLSKHGATKVTPFELVYGQEAVLPIEINLQSCRLKYQDQLGVEEYHSMMIDEIDDITETRLEAFREIEEKLKVTKAYNKRVREKSFQVDELV